MGKIFKTAVILGGFLCVASAFFVACADSDDCGTHHLYYTSGGRSYEYGSASACNDAAVRAGYKCYSYVNGVCNAYCTGC